MRTVYCIHPRDQEGGWSQRTREEGGSGWEGPGRQKRSWLATPRSVVMDKLYVVSVSDL